MNVSEVWDATKHRHARQQLAAWDCTYCYNNKPLRLTNWLTAFAVPPYLPDFDKSVQIGVNSVNPRRKLGTVGTVVLVTLQNQLPQVLRSLEVLTKVLVSRT